MCSRAADQRLRENIIDPGAHSEGRLYRLLSRSILSSVSGMLRKLAKRDPALEACALLNLGRHVSRSRTESSDQDVLICGEKIQILRCKTPKG
jgi:hypothetical protein